MMSDVVTRNILRKLYMSVPNTYTADEYPCDRNEIVKYHIAYRNMLYNWVNEHSNHRLRCSIINKSNLNVKRLTADVDYDKETSVNQLLPDKLPIDDSMLNNWESSDCTTNSNQSSLDCYSDCGDESSFSIQMKLEPKKIKKESILTKLCRIISKPFKFVFKGINKSIVFIKKMCSVKNDDEYVFDTVHDVYI